jgi:hypothetical protein
LKVGQISSKTLTKVHGIYRKFSMSFTLCFNKILIRFINDQNLSLQPKFAVTYSIMAEHFYAERRGAIPQRR